MRNLEIRCIICLKIPVDRCHIKSKGSGGPDKDFNFMYLCRRHHQEQHRIGIITFIKKYTKVEKYLLDRGWYIHDNFDKPQLTNDLLRNEQ